MGYISNTLYDMKRSIHTIKIRNQLELVCEKYLFELNNKSTIDRFTDDCIKVLYNNGYNDSFDSVDFQPVILGVNLIIHEKDNQLIGVDYKPIVKSDHIELISMKF